MYLIVASARSQHNLIYEKSPLDELGDVQYATELRYVFRIGFQSDVDLRAIILPVFKTEYMSGIRYRGNFFEAFVLRPTVRVENYSLLRAYESGDFTRLDSNGKIIDYKKDKIYQLIRNNTPEDYRNIHTKVMVHAISVELVRRIKRLWDIMLHDVVYNDRSLLIIDGVQYYFSANVENLGILCGYMISYDQNSRTESLGKLAEMLAKFADSRITEQDLQAAIEAAERRMSNTMTSTIFHAKSIGHFRFMTTSKAKKKRPQSLRYSEWNG